MKKNTSRWVVLSILLTALLIVLSSSTALFAQEQLDETAVYIRAIEYLFRYIEDNYVDEVDKKQLYEGALKGMLDSLEDPYTTYLTADDIEKLRDVTTGQFGGVGLYISKPNPDSEAARRPNGRYVEVIAPIQATPAYRAGMHSGDYITAINGESTAGMHMDEVLSKLRGPKGEAVEITVKRGNASFDVTIVRDIIEVPTIKKDMIGESIGYLQIIDWTPNTPLRVEETLKEFVSNGMTHLIVDVRGNPGGLLNSVVAVSDLFLDGGVIVSTKSRVPGQNKVDYANRYTAVPKSIPLIVLIDKGSASASEIFAGAMKDTERGILLGQTSFGKGSVQTIRHFGDGGFKMTMSRYYTPADMLIDSIGVEPNIFVDDISIGDFTDEELDMLAAIYERGLVESFVDTNPVESREATDAFLDELYDQNLLLDELYLRRLIRNRYFRKMDFPPVYDLEFDLGLQKALELIKDGEVK